MQWRQGTQMLVMYQPSSCMMSSCLFKEIILNFILINLFGLYLLILVYFCLHSFSFSAHQSSPNGYLHPGFPFSLLLRRNSLNLIYFSISIFLLVVKCGEAVSNSILISATYIDNYVQLSWGCLFAIAVFRHFRKYMQ